MAHLSTLGPNISWIGEVCDTLDTTSLTSLVDNHWPTAGLRVNSSFLKAGIRSNPLFLLEGITILPSTPSAGCDGLVWIFHEKLGETTCLLLVKFSEVWGILKFFQSFGRHLAVHLQTKCLVRLH